MKILEITNYTKGGCGVGMRVLKESQLLADRGHKVTIFSTNKVKGSEELCLFEESQGKLKIKRFPARKLGGESYMHWSFEKEAINFKPDIIIVHVYRHLHTTKALNVAKKIGCKVFLVTHAPFGRENSRSFIANVLVRFYDRFIGRKRLKEFDKIITITKWELPYLRKLGIGSRNIEYIPNGISDEFFKPIKKIDKNKVDEIIYTGRISPIKNLQIISHALAFLNENGFLVKIKGPADKEYLKKIKRIAKENRLEKREIFIPESYNSIEQINELDRAGIFILPSISEGMPQTLVEAMSRGRIVIGSDNDGNKELIKDGKNGFLFNNGDYKHLAKVLEKIKGLSQKEIGYLQKNSRKTAEQFRWIEIIKKLESLLKID
ncbi:MAG: glycosyltransferase family 4 protein [Nanoarchaeota archaeon]